jgi:hypothetical protein
MKRILFLLIVVLLASCSGYHTVPKFYERHNVGDNKAYYMPSFKEKIMDSLSPYTRNMLLDVVDLRYIELNEEDFNENELLKIEIKALFRKRFRDIQRVTLNDSIKIVSMKVNDNIAKELIVYFNKDKRNQIFYIAGDLDPNAVRDFISSDDHRLIMNVMNPENFEEDDANLKNIYRKQEEKKKKKKTE